MLRHSHTACMRLLCLTMLPDGGALTPALQTLGYTPYTLRTSLQQGRARTHPIEWSQILDRKKSVDKSLFSDCDCFVGPPAALVYDVILRDCPPFTKVILVEEPNKARWAAMYEARLAKLKRAMRRISRNKISVNFSNMLDKMVVRGTEEDSGAGNLPAGPSSVSSFSYAHHRSRRDAISSSSALETALRAEMKSASSQAAHASPPTDSSAEELESNREADAASDSAADKAAEESSFPVSPRAVALARYEESVKMAVPTDRLLVYRYGDGWEPLCSFLERAVPDEPFPPYDDGLEVLSSLQERIRRAESTMHVLVFFTVVVAIATAWPYLAGVRRFLAETYEDYRLAFGNGESVELAPAAQLSTPSEKFDDMWKKRGGLVLTEKDQR